MSAFDCYDIDSIASECAGDEGWKPEVYAIFSEQITGITVASGVATALSLVSGKKAYEFACQDDAVDAEQTSDPAKLVNNWSHTVSAILHNNTQAAINNVNALAIGRWVFIVVSKSGQPYIAGADAQSRINGLKVTCARTADNSGGWVITAKSEKFMHGSALVPFTPTGGWATWKTNNVA